MALIVIPFTFSAGAVIIAYQHNSNFSTIASDYNGNVDNTNIASGAGILYSKLTLTNGIVNADINSSAAIADSKLAAISTAGKVSGAALTSLSSIPSGAGNIPIANLGNALTVWAPTNIQVFVATGTWTKPAGVSKVYVKVWGAGGTGGVNTSLSRGGGGGGGGGYSEGFTAVSTNVTVTIGATNSFAGTTTIQATAGSNGTAGANSGSPAGGAGGTGSNGTINLTGSIGQNGTTFATIGASGGGSFGGVGGYGGDIVTLDGYPGGKYGGGGGGTLASQNGSGGAGDAGAVIVYY